MGSLFQLREHWYASFAGEEFGVGCLVSGPLANDDGDDVIAVGSYAGCLRILAPSSSKSSNSNNNNNKTRGTMAPHELLCEKRLGEPILQLCCGAFVPDKRDDAHAQQQRSDNVVATASSAARATGSGRMRNALAVLLPRRVLFVHVQRHRSDDAQATTTATPRSRHNNVAVADDDNNNNNDDVPQSTDELASIGDVCECVVVRDVSLERSMCNMVAGAFTCAAHDMLCAQSMDGHLYLLDHTGVLYECVLPANQFMLPGCLAYCAATDSIVMGNSAMLVLCYRVTDLANAAQHRDLATTTMTTTATTTTSDYGSDAHTRTLRPRWAYSVGEDVLALDVCRLTRGLRAGDVDVVVLCPYALHVLSVDGVCRLMRLFEVEALSMCAYAMPAIAQHNVLITTHDKTLLVYDDVTLCWSAALPAWGGGGGGAGDTTTATAADRNAVVSSSSPQNDNADDDDDVKAVCVAVARVCGVRGMIVTLTSSGVLATSYLGTDPADKTTQPLEAHAQSYQDMRAALHDVNDAIALQQQVQPLQQVAATATTVSASATTAAPLAPVVATAATAAAVAPTRDTPRVQLRFVDVRTMHAKDSNNNNNNDNTSSSPPPPPCALPGYATALLTLSVSVHDTDEPVDVHVHVCATAPLLVTPARVRLTALTCAQPATLHVHAVAVAQSSLRNNNSNNDNNNDDNKSECTDAHAAVVVTPSSLVVRAVAVAVPSRNTHDDDHDNVHDNDTDVAHMVSSTATQLLPLALVARLVPVKRRVTATTTTATTTATTLAASSHTVQINTDKTPPPPTLWHLFADLADAVEHDVALCGSGDRARDGGGGGGGVLAVRVVDGSETTLTMSRHAARFLVQAMSMHGLWLLSSEVVRRVRDYYYRVDAASAQDDDKDNNNDDNNYDDDNNDKDNNEDMALSLSSSLQLSIPTDVPLDDFAAAVHAHASARAALQRAHAQLAEVCAFLRVLQGRLLARFRERAIATTAKATTTTTTTAAIEALLTESYIVLQQRLDAVQATHDALRVRAAAMRCCAHMLHLWLSTLCAHGDDMNATRQVLHRIFVCDVARIDDDDDDDVAAATAAVDECGGSSSGNDHVDASSSNSSDDTATTTTWARRTEAALTRLLALRPAVATVTASAATSLSSRLRFCVEQLTERLRCGEAIA